MKNLAVVSQCNTVSLNPPVACHVEQRIALVPQDQLGRFVYAVSVVRNTLGVASVRCRLDSHRILRQALDDLALLREHGEQVGTQIDVLLGDEWDSLKSGKIASMIMARIEHVFGGYILSAKRLALDRFAKAQRA